MSDIKRYSTTETATLIRKELKVAFPKVKFSVRSSSYSGGSSIRVNWIDGPTAKEVERVAGAFAGATFDGMQDLKSYHESNYGGERVQFGADFVFCDRKLSADHLRRAVRVANVRYGWSIPEAVVVQSGTYAYVNRTPETDARPSWSNYTTADEINKLAYRMRQDGIIVVSLNDPRPEPKGPDASKDADVRRLVGQLWKTSEEYHAGAISHDELGQQNRSTWSEVETLGLRAEVSTMLRDAAKGTANA